MRVQIELCVDFGQSIRLSEISHHRSALLVHGVYIITEGKPVGKKLNSASNNVVYIGKAIKQTVYDRCKQHVQSVVDAKSKSGKPASGPGHSFKKYRERINYDKSLLWVTPGLMDVDIPYAISCAEEYLLHKFRLKHGRYPECNSAGQKRSVETVVSQMVRTKSASVPDPVGKLKSSAFVKKVLVEAIVHGTGKHYKDGMEKMYLHFRKSDGHGFPIGEAVRTSISLHARGHEYTGFLRSRAGYDYLFVSPEVADEKSDKHKMTYLLAEWGLAKAGRVEASIAGTRITLSV